MDIVGNSKFTLPESFITPNAVVLHHILSFARSLNHYFCVSETYTKLVLYKIQFLNNEFGFT